MAAAKWLFDSSRVVFELEPEFFDSLVVSSKRTWIVMYYSHNCHHCKQFAGRFSHIAERLGHDDRISFGAVDCVGCPAWCADMGVETFPSLVAYHMPDIPVSMAKGGQVADITTRPQEAMVMWIRDYLKLEKNWSSRLAAAEPKATARSVRKLCEANRKMQMEKMREKRKHGPISKTTKAPFNITEFNTQLSKTIDDEWSKDPMMEKLHKSKELLKNKLLLSTMKATPVPTLPRPNRTLPPQEVGNLKPAKGAGLCLSFGSSIAEDADEAFVEVQNCDGSRQQVWYFRKYQLVNAASRKCIQEGPATGGEAKVLLASCDSSGKSEKFNWYWNDQQLRSGLDDKCMQTSMARKGRVQMGHCYGGSSQKWILKLQSNNSHGFNSEAPRQDASMASVASLPHQVEVMWDSSSHMLWFLIGWITLCGIVSLMRRSRGRSTKPHKSPRDANIIQQDIAGHGGNTSIDKRSFDA